MSFALGSKSFSDKLNNPQIEELENLKVVFRDIFFYYFNKNKDDLNTELDISKLKWDIDLLNTRNRRSNKIRSYQAGTIFAKEYSKDDLISNNITEEDLEKDFLDFIKIFEFAEKHKIFEKVEKISKFNPLDLAGRVNVGENILFYGVPGSGKSHKIEDEYCKEDTITERVLFHPDYTYSDFVGQILPIVSEEDKIEYKFTPGPFTTILKKAYKNPRQKFLLIIEEINRGNAPAIFGDIFQLLDRKTEKKKSVDDGVQLGTSEYGINNQDIAYEVYDDKEHEVRIPSNLRIIASMNTSDQNVFTLDTAFQRRWDMRLVQNDFKDNDFGGKAIKDTGVSWENFNTIINKEILHWNKNKLSSEDKRLGAFFIKKEDLEDLNKFSEKVLKYLWDDAFKFHRTEIFDVEEFSLECLIDKFKDANYRERFDIFKDPIRQDLKAKFDDNLLPGHAQNTKSKNGGLEEFHPDNVAEESEEEVGESASDIPQKKQALQ